MPLSHDAREQIYRTTKSPDAREGPPVSQPPAEAESGGPQQQSIRPRVTDSKASAQVASIASLSNVRRELKTIGILAGASLSFS